MIYKIKHIKENVYEVLFQGQKVVVDYPFLYDKLKSYKKDELARDGETSTRGNWIFPDSVQTQEVDTRDKKTFQYPHGYIVESSKSVYMIMRK